MSLKSWASLWPTTFHALRCWHKAPIPGLGDCHSPNRMSCEYKPTKNCLAPARFTRLALQLFLVTWYLGINLQGLGYTWNDNCHPPLSSLLTWKPGFGLYTIGDKFPKRKDVAVNHDLFYPPTHKKNITWLLPTLETSPQSQILNMILVNGTFI